MNILFLSIGRLDNIEDKGLYTDLLRQFSRQGDKVYVVSPRERRLNKPTKYETENDVSFLRVKIGNITKTNIVEKGISTLLIETLYLQAIKKHFKDIKFDLIIYSTPPITFEKIIRYIKKRDKAKSYLLLKDIFPQNAVDLNMFSKRNPIYRYFRSKERKLYAQSDFIGCMSQANVDFILKHNKEVTENKIEVCPNSIEPIAIEKDENQRNTVRKKYNIPLDKTVFIYGGNLGKPQGIDYLIECLSSNKNNEHAYFLIAGSGTEFNKLKIFLDNEKLTNVQLFDYLPKKDYELLANSCDVGLIFLDHRFTIPNFPSRLLSYMQASMPVLAAIDMNTDIGQVIEDGEFGLWCSSNDVDAFNERLDRLCNKKTQEKMGKNARRYLEENYTTDHSYEIIMNHFK